MENRTVKTASTRKKSVLYIRKVLKPGTEGCKIKDLNQKKGFPEFLVCKLCIRIRSTKIYSRLVQ